MTNQQTNEGAAKQTNRRANHKQTNNKHTIERGHTGAS